MHTDWRSFKPLHVSRSSKAVFVFDANYRFHKDKPTRKCVLGLRVAPTAAQLSSLNQRNISLIIRLKV